MKLFSIWNFISYLFQRLHNKIQTLTRIFNHGGRSLRQIKGYEIDSPDILIIGPGEMMIPTQSWGAVEIVIANQMKNLENRGYAVSLLNSWFYRDWILLFIRKPKFVLCHYDVFTFRLFIYRTIFRVPCYVVTHFGYTRFPEKWSGQYRRILKFANKLDGVIALSEFDRKAIEAVVDKEKLFCVPNGGEDLFETSFRPKIETKSQRSYICLGKVEPRKRQVQLAKLISEIDLDITFVGPIVDSNFYELDERTKLKFVGPWTRKQVQELLPTFDYLILFSDGEADALVLHEAMFAGLNICVSLEAIGSVSPKLPWVHQFSNLHDFISAYSSESLKYFEDRTAIREYAAAQSNWDLNVERLLNLFHQSKFP